MAVDFILFLLILTLPFQLGRHFWLKDSFVFGLKVDYLSPTLYLQDILIIILLAMIFFKKRLWSFTSTKLLVLRNLVLAVSLIFCFLNIKKAISPPLSFFTWLRWVEFILLGLVLSGYSQKVWRILFRVFPFLIIFESLLGFGQMLRQSSFNGLFWFLGERNFNILTPGIARGSFWGKVFLRPYGTFSHPNSLAGFILVSLILLLAKEKVNWQDKAALIVGSLLIVASFSSVALAAGFLTGLFFILNNRSKSFWTKCFSLFFLGALFLELQLKDSSSLVTRKDLILVAFSLIKSKPFLGVGANNFILGLTQIQPIWKWLSWLQPVHNIFFLIASEVGLTGLLALVALFYLAFRQTLQNKNLNFRFSIFTALLVIVFTGLFDHYWLTLIQNQLLLTLVFALSFGASSVKMRT